VALDGISIELLPMFVEWRFVKEFELVKAGLWAGF
jgi:hypothetical protein